MEFWLINFCRIWGFPGVLTDVMDIVTFPSLELIKDLCNSMETRSRLTHCNWQWFPLPLSSWAVQEILYFSWSAIGFPQECCAFCCLLGECAELKWMHLTGIVGTWDKWCYLGLGPSSFTKFFIEGFVQVFNVRFFKLPIFCVKTVKMQLVYKMEGFSVFNQDLLGTRESAVGKFSFLHTDY